MVYIFIDSFNVSFSRTSMVMNTCLQFDEYDCYSRHLCAADGKILVEDIVKLGSRTEDANNPDEDGRM